jgi:hypothetical protein
MDHQPTVEELSWLRDQYRQAAVRYEAAKNATDAAETARDAAGQACDAARQAWETACAEELHQGQVLRQAALAYQTASDAVFLTEIGIVPSSVLTNPTSRHVKRGAHVNDCE